MTKRLYKLMNWADVEGIIYSEEDNPHRILGPHSSGLNTLLQFYYPSAVKATVLTSKDAYPMELADEEGFFAVLLPKGFKSKYTIEFQTEDGKTKEIYDPYMFKSLITQNDIDKFKNGIHYYIYQMLGAHPKTIDKIKGIYFAVWAPHALRVSVVGDFNNWDGRVHQMRRIEDSGIFELFIPCANCKDNYKFEIKTKTGIVFLKTDPYGNEIETSFNAASVVSDFSGFTWQDNEWMKNRNADKPMSIYEFDISYFDKNVKNYKDLAKKVISYMKEMGYTHIQLMPFGLYAPNFTLGTAKDFMSFINELHKNSFGVILEWSVSCFTKEEFGLSGFDGSFLYENADEVIAEHPYLDAKFYDYSCPQVVNYLLSNAFFWLEEFHMDGFKIGDLDSILYLDYGKQETGWMANIYGGNENLEAIEFLKHFNSIVHKCFPGVITIADGIGTYMNVTQKLSDGGLGFDFMYNNGWKNDISEYMKFDPYFRSHHHDKLTINMLYTYNEKFILSLGEAKEQLANNALIKNMPGEVKDKLANLRLVFGYMMMHPGAKLFSMGQDIALFEAISDDNGIDWGLLSEASHKSMKEYVKELHKCYKEYPALYLLDDDSDGFEWINNIAADENVLVFLRKTEDAKDTMLVVCNFANETRKVYQIGVPYPGKYKEIFNSDARKFGGLGTVNGRQIASEELDCDGRENSICIKMPALSVQVFSYTEFTPKEKEEIELKKEQERKRKLEEKEYEEAKEAEKRARDMAGEARMQAKRAQDEAKEALKRAMEEAQRAEALEKEAQLLAEKRKKVKEEAEFI